MQRTRFSKILQSDLTDIPDRIPGNHILQSHGNSVSRGDLITQDNISAPGPWTVTINKDTYASLCQQATSWSQVGYSSTYKIVGSIATDNDGIYASISYGQGGAWHGPLFYTTLPSEIGKAGQYWHITFKVKATFTDNTPDTQIYTYTRVGFSTFMQYLDYRYNPFNGSGTGVAITSVQHNSSQQFGNGELNTRPAVGSTNTYTFKFYHYQNNTFKTYINGTLYKDQADTMSLDKGSNIAACQILQNSTYATTYIRVQEITVSTDPTYDPQP